MLAVLYLLIALFFGDRLRRLLLPRTPDLFASLAPKSPVYVPAALFDLPAAMVLGLPPMLWATYAVAVLASDIPGLTGLSHPLFPANLVVMSAAFILSLVLTGRLRDRSYTERLTRDLPDVDGQKRSLTDFFQRTGLYIPVLIGMTLFGLWLFRYGFHVEDGRLLAGYSIFSDFGPHTALVSSFSRGANFPAEYPHFPMDGIRYHFLFFFLCGNLDFLGLPIDWAINLPSLMGLVAFCCLLGALGALLTGRRLVFLAAPVLLFLRPSFAFVTFLRDTMRAGSTLFESIGALFHTQVFIGNTLHEDWGLFSINVFANQRHLLFGMCALLFLLFVFIPLLKSGLQPLSPDRSAWSRVLSVRAWVPTSLHTAIAVLVVVACLPYLHGSVLIASLILIAGMLPFSSGRLLHLSAIAIAVLSARFQAAIFSGGAENVADLTFRFGFLADQATLPGVIAYIVELLGVAAFLIAVVPWIQSGRYRTILSVVFLLPLAFAFLFSLTPDISVNHKYILIALALSGVFVADLLIRLWKRPGHAPLARRVDVPDGQKPVRLPGIAGTGLTWVSEHLDALKPVRFLKRHPEQVRRAGRILRRVLVVVLVVFLTATGVADITTYRNINRNTVAMDLDSQVAAWIQNNTEPKAVFLTDDFSYDAFFYSGRLAYYGHPYYAWSAGHDTGTREQAYRSLLTGCDGNYNDFRALSAEENVSYVLITDRLRSDDEADLNEAFFAQNFPELAAFPSEGHAVIYDLR